MAKVEVYSKNWCGYCGRVRALLDAKGVAYSTIDVTSDPDREREMIARSGATSVPQIFIDDQRVGGHDDLFSLHANGELDTLLTEANLSGHAVAAH